MKNKTNIHIISQKERKASITMLMPFDGAFSVHQKPVPQAVVEALAKATADLNDEQIAVRSQFFDTEVKVDTRGPQFHTVGDVLPNEQTDYIFPLFRAISASIIPGYWVEYPADVLRASVPLLEGRTVYKNHDRFDVEKWVGAVNQSLWDAEGAQSEGVPGINTELKIDIKVSPLIARGLLMEPPAIDCVSVTVVFTFDYSHPDIEKDSHWRFRDLLGEEVDGEIVRFVATEILDYHEISLVYRGADRLARGVDRGDEEDEELSAPPPKSTSNSAPPPATPKERTTVKVSEQRKQALGLTEHQGEEVPDDVVLTAVDKLVSQAAAGQTLLTSARAECLRVATLAEGTDGQLPPALAALINGAGADQLPQLTEVYTEKAAAKYPPKCQQCGSTNVSGRSSVEELPEEKDARAPAPVRNSARQLHP